ncbi:MAG: pyrroline-5-carboxylate reductase [Sulfurovum sp.]|nr:pyrroline-5-carboxylate reductase [Sulfurovum sp.]MCB4745152.1 pyrroline-5-carboxylate reductase [Sulfurovum sp.]MCB4749229.1 pyrroline-5-carboxylate reductase [Sulfurovum sp.]MCB4749994.1 pyrroline-5-carboxylate reductase [Sulfurovum sp.]MCB4751387.1 pyrroline-5-carboxylate reductase [Sulfurovum sp.]
MQTITFIGNGAMALSIAKGLKEQYSIEVVGRNMERLNAFETALGTKIKKFLLEEFNITDKTILLCIKPGNLENVSKLLKGEAKLLLSVLAGTSIDKLKKEIKSKSVIRAMPNLAASEGASMTTLTGDIYHRKEAEKLMRSMGEVLWLESEKEINIATALSGSGPAYLALIAEAFTDGAVNQGLKREDAIKVMQGLFAGFGKLITKMHPALLKDSVMSPGGTTAAGYGMLEKGNVRASCMGAIEKAYQKACDLS